MQCAHPQGQGVKCREVQGVVHSSEGPERCLSLFLRSNNVVMIV